MGTHALSEALTAVRPGWLALALALHLGAQVCRGLAWHGTLLPLCPRVRRREVCAWHVAGAGLSGVLSARGGDAVRLGLARRAQSETCLATLGGSLALETSSETLFGLVVTVVALAMGIGSLPAPSPWLMAGVVAVAAAALVIGSRRPRARQLIRETGAGFQALRRPARYATTVLPFQLVGRTARLASMASFLLAFGLPASPAVVLAVCAAQGSGRMIPLPGVGTAAAAAGLMLVIPVAAGHAVSTPAVSALALAQPALLTLLGLAISATLLVATAGARSPRALLAAARARPAVAPA